MNSAIKDFSDLPTNTLDEEGKPPETRLKDANSALAIYNLLVQGDKQSSLMRARVQGMLDGLPPYDAAKLRATGQGFRTNINFGEGEKYLEQAMSAYVDLTNSVEQIARIETNYGDPNERKEWSRVISEEFSLSMRSWNRYSFEFLNLCNHFLAHGVGVKFFEDADSWKWRSTGLGDFLIPRDTKSTETDIDVACARRKMTVPQLYQYIKNPEAAKAMGWDVEVVTKVIQQACSGDEQWDNWEKLQQQLKNNDLYVQSKAPSVELVHLWIREFDGSISHVIVDAREETGKYDIDGKPAGFMYYKPKKYGSVNQAYTIFSYGIGTNGTYHSIRGLGYKIFSQIQLNNRIRCQAIDNAMVAGAPMVQPQDERALEDMAFNYFGPFAVIPPGVNVVDRAIPNVAQTMMPVLSDMDRLTQERAGQYSSSGVFQGDQRKSRFEVAANLEESSKLNDTALNLFYHPYDRHIQEVVRRFFAPNYSEQTDGYTEVKDFRERCINRGVPEEALDMIDHKRTRAVRAVGNGSAGKRTVQLQQLNELAGVFDEEGRHNLFRDQTAAIVGHDAANRYIPARPDGRYGVHAKLAQMENHQLMEGKEIDVLPDEVHLTHLEFHVPELEELFQLVEAGQVELIDAFVPALPLFQHSTVHLENIQQDFTIADKVNEYNERLQNISELIVNGQKAMEKLQREAEANPPEDGSQQEQQGPSPEQMMKFEEHRLKLQQIQEKHEQQQMINLQKHQQNMALEDAKRAVDLQDLLK